MTITDGLRPLPRPSWRRHAGWIGIAPLAVLLVIAFAIPVGSLLRLSFGEGDFTLEHFARIVTVPLYRSVLLTTLTISATTTLLCVVMSYPVAYLMATVGPRMRAVLIVVVLFAATGSVIIYKMADIDVE